MSSKNAETGKMEQTLIYFPTPVSENLEGFDLDFFYQFQYFHGNSNMFCEFQGVFL